jgi:uncharacterized protein (TIGR02265 family)
MNSTAQKVIELPAPPRIRSADFDARLALATAQDSARGMFFNGVLSAVNARAGKVGADQCLLASGEKRFVDFFNYPITSFLKLSFTAAEVLQPLLGDPATVFTYLGRQAVDDFLATASGKMMLALSGKSPARMLNNTPAAFKAAVSYGEREVTWLSPTHAAFTMARDFMPHPYHVGVLTRVIEAMEVKPLVVGRQTGPLDAHYDVSWS